MTASLYSQALADEIVEWVSEGKPLRAYCRQEGKPGKSTITDWRKAHPEFDKAFLIARDMGADALAEQCLEIADDETHDWELSKKGPILNEVAIGRAKLQVETRLKLLAKWFPQKYGDKLDLNHGGSVGFAIRVRRQAEQKDGDEPA